MYRLSSWTPTQKTGEENESGDSVDHPKGQQQNKGLTLIYEANVKYHKVAAMTGSNVTNGSNGTAATERGCWTIGLINSKYKYLSAETFGFKINANGKALKKKQVWILEPSGDGDTIVMRSHLNKYLAVDQFGNVTCDQVIIIKTLHDAFKVLGLDLRQRSRFEKNEIIFFASIFLSLLFEENHFSHASLLIL